MDDVERLKQEVREGRIDPDRLVGLVATLQRRLQEAPRRIEELEKKLGGSGTAKTAEPFSMRAEEQRQQARGKQSRKRQRPLRRGRQWLATVELDPQARRLMRKKNRNVAVVAAARKLAAIAWRMLATNEPYRYAIPRSTETKLARLRVKATGQRRGGGSPKGEKAVAKLPGGSRTIKSLAGVCQAENLPPPKSLSRGENRTIEEAACADFVAQLGQTQVVPRRGSQRR